MKGTAKALQMHIIKTVAIKVRQSRQGIRKAYLFGRNKLHFLQSQAGKVLVTREGEHSYQ